MFTWAKAMKKTVENPISVNSSFWLYAYLQLQFCGIICQVVVSEDKWGAQRWSSFQCSVAVTAIFLARKSSQSEANMFQKENDTT